MILVGVKRPRLAGLKIEEIRTHVWAALDGLRQLGR